LSILLVWHPILTIVLLCFMCICALELINRMMMMMMMYVTALLVALYDARFIWVARFNETSSERQHLYTEQQATSGKKLPECVLSMLFSVSTLSLEYFKYAFQKLWLKVLEYNSYVQDIKTNLMNLRYSKSAYTKCWIIFPPGLNLFSSVLHVSISITQLKLWNIHRVNRTPRRRGANGCS